MRKTGRFAEALTEICGDWLAGFNSAPVIMCGMVGSKLGWTEVPLLPTPVRLGDLGRHLCSIRRLFRNSRDRPWCDDG